MNQSDDNIKAAPAVTNQSKKTLINRVVFALIVIIFILGPIFLYARHRAAANKAAESAKYQQMINTTNQAASLDDLGKEKSLLETFLKAPPHNQNYLYEAEIRLTSTCISLKNYACSNEWGNKAIKLQVNNKSASIYELLGDADVDQKKYDEAVSFYNQSIDILKTSKDPTIGAPLGRVQSKVSYVNNVLKKQ